MNESNKTDKLDYECRLCTPFACDDPDNHLGVPSEYTPLKNKGCTCDADITGRDCMCFEDRATPGPAPRGLSGIDTPPGRAPRGLSGIDRHWPH